MGSLLNKSITTLTKRSFLLLPIILLTINALFAQTNWNGNTSNAWANPANWSAGVPDAADEVIIPSGRPNQPTISAAGAVAQSIIVVDGAILTISSAGVLTINGSTSGEGISNQGTVINSGTINIGTTASTGDFGIWNTATFNNNTGGKINIDRSTDAGLYNGTGSTFTNQGMITIGASQSTGNYGLENAATFNNNAGGQIKIDRATLSNLYNTSGTFNNRASIIIGSIASSGYGVQNAATFNNETGGQITIDRSGGIGLYNTSNTFNNQATITIGATVSNGNFGLQNSGTFNNNTGGQINIDRSNVIGLYNSSGMFTNQATITIGGTASVTGYGLQNNTAFNNNTGGQINISRATNVALYHTLGNFNNRANITIGASGPITNEGILNVSFFNNLTGGQITIDNCEGTGIRNNNAFTNQAGITIGVNASVGYYGIRNQASFVNNIGGQISINGFSSDGIWHTANTFSNNATINISGSVGMGVEGIFNQSFFENNETGVLTINAVATIGILNDNNFSNSGNLTIGSTGSGGAYGIRNQGTFISNAGAQVNIDRATFSGLLNFSGIVANSGTMQIGALVPMSTLISTVTGIFGNGTGGILKGTGTISSANFLNSGGTLSPGYSPGKMTFDASRSFSSSILAIEVNGTGVAGTNYDQVVVNGTATLGGTLALSINYVPTSGDQVTILTATSRTGNFNSVTGLLPGWIVNYTSTGVILSYGALPVELTDFTARPLEKLIQLDWQTASENNNKGFYIERSNDARRWTEIGFVTGKGTTTEAHNYSLLDKVPLLGLNYYRLRQIDFDGQEEISKIVNVDLQNVGSIRVFPNPANNGEMTLFLPENAEEGLTARLFSPTGQLLRSILVNSETSLLDISDLEPGIYYLEIVDKPDWKVMKIVVGNSNK